jgi:hypothetical protein
VHAETVSPYLEELVTRLSASFVYDCEDLPGPTYVTPVKTSASTASSSHRATHDDSLARRRA